MSLEAVGNEDTATSPGSRAGARGLTEGRLEPYTEPNG